jgi:uncharacterized protein DUF3634
LSNLNCDLLMFDFLKRFFSPAVFEIRFKGGDTTLTRGKVTRAFIQECLEVCNREKLDAITVYGVNSDYGVRLEFSSNTPKSCQQMFRNIWEIHK